ncbi:MAG: C-GCAxxG-C-C family protein [Kiritimatiellia bacterium]
MNRRNALKIIAGGLAVGGGAGITALTTAFKPDVQPLDKPEKLEFNNADPKWLYHRLDPDVTADMAYNFYRTGSCMYGVVNSFISQLAAEYGKPYSSFPVHMMKYGHGGVGGYGTVCGALNGASSLIGLFVADKTIQNALINDIFKWYETTPLPIMKPDSPVLNFTPPQSTSGSTLCHASTTFWSEISGYRVESQERKERCRRITGDVAARLAVVMNQLIEHNYVTACINDETTQTCISCHDKKGKLGNTNTRMRCNSCHDKSVGHALS